MHIHSIAVDDIRIDKNRYRKEFLPERVIDLAGSITANGLLSPVVVRKSGDGGFILCCGERRIKALQYIWNFGEQVRCGDYQFPDRQVPCLLLNELDEIAARTIEIEENVQRVDFTWQEKALAVESLMALRTAQSQQASLPPPTILELTEEIKGEKKAGSEANFVSQQLIVARNLSNPAVAKAKSTSEAFKILKREDQIARNAKLAETIGATFNSSAHQLFNDDCRSISADFEAEKFDVIVTDPPYGIDADTYGDSGGAGGSKGEHFYSDSWRYFNELMQWFATESFRVCKPHSHIYIFCDVDNFVLLKSFMTSAGWNVFRTPLVWFNPQGARAPWPEKGPQRKSQYILFAIKGERTVSRLLGDVLNHASDPQLNHPAQKPVTLYRDLLLRSANPGDTVADYFMGSGTIIPAAHELKLKAVGIELDKAAYGTAITRLKGLE